MVTLKLQVIHIKDVAFLQTLFLLAFVPLQQNLSPRLLLLHITVNLMDPFPIPRAPVRADSLVSRFDHELHLGLCVGAVTNVPFDQRAPCPPLHDSGSQPYAHLHTDLQRSERLLTKPEPACMLMSHGMRGNQRDKRKHGKLVRTLYAKLIISAKYTPLRSLLCMS